MTHRRSFSYVVACAGMMACGPVGESDGSLWQSSHDIGGTQYNPATGVSQASGATPGQGGPPGSGNYPGNNPGGNPPPGGGGSTGGFPPPNGTGGPFNPGNGGSVGSGGSPPSGGGVTPTGSGGTPVVAGPPPPPGNSGPCNFTFNATTVTAHGAYSPKNVGALWIEDGSGKFVKSLEVWGATRLSNLTAWVNNSGNNAAAKVDAVTSATLPNHIAHSDHWDCSDVNHASVPNGAYQGCVSFAEDDSFFGFGPAAHVACTPFNKGAPGTVTPPNQANFTNMSLTMQ